MKAYTLQEFEKKNLPIASVKVPLAAETLGQMVSVAEQICALTNTVQYRKVFRDMQQSTNFNWNFVQDVSSPLKGEIISCDFHLDSTSQPKLIEYSFFPPGMAGIAHFLLSSKRYFLAESYEEKFFQIFEPYTNIAIVDRDLREQIFYSEFQYIQKVLEQKYQKNVWICEPAQLVESAGKLFFEHQEIDFVFNRLPFADVEENSARFLDFAELQNRFPEKFCTPFREWCFSDKSALALFSQIEFWQSIGLSQYEHLYAAMPKTRFLDSFATLSAIESEFDSLRKTIIKPINSRSGKGIFLKPSRTLTEKLLREQSFCQYLIQEYIPAPKIASGQKYDLRLILLHGKVEAIMARVFSGGITNFREENSGFATVQIIDTEMVS